MSSYNPHNTNSTTPLDGLSLQRDRSKLLAPGVALIVVGTIGLLLMAALFALTVFSVASGANSMAPPPNVTDEAERVGHYIGSYGVVVMMMLNAFLQIVVILGGVAMVRAKNRSLAFIGSVISVIPCFGSSLCLLGVPFGIWALVVLSDSNVKRVFN